MTTSPSSVLITGNTYPVREQLKALGGTWDAARKGWCVPSDRADQARALVSAAPTTSRSSAPPARRSTCRVCGHRATGRYGDVIYRSGECRDCFEERKMGY